MQCKDKKWIKRLEIANFSQFAGQNTNLDTF